MSYATYILSRTGEPDMIVSVTSSFPVKLLNHPLMTGAIANLVVNKI